MELSTTAPIAGAMQSLSLSDREEQAPPTSSNSPRAYTIIKDPMTRSFDASRYVRECLTRGECIEIDEGIRGFVDIQNRVKIPEEVKRIDVLWLKNFIAGMYGLQPLHKRELNVKIDDPLMQRDDPTTNEIRDFVEHYPIDEQHAVIQKLIRAKAFSDFRDVLLSKEEQEVWEEHEAKNKRSLDHTKQLVRKGKLDEAREFVKTIEDIPTKNSAALEVFTRGNFLSR